MGNQFINHADEKLKPAPLPIAVDDKPLEIDDDAFKQPYHVRAVYNALSREYSERILPKFGHIAKAAGQFPPYWDDAKNQPQQLPLYQHNVSSGKFIHSISQLALTYNSFFPNRSYSKSLIEVKLLNDPFGMEPTKDGAPQTAGQDYTVPKQTPKDQTQTYLHDNARLIEQAYDNLIKKSDWAKREHLKMVADMLHYNVGIYFFKDPGSYKYISLDFRKCRFPIGSSTNPDEWEYMFVEHDESFSELVSKWKSTPSGWKKEGLEALLKILINQAIQRGAIHQIAGITDQTKQIDDVRLGLSQFNYGQVCPARIPLISCFWKGLNGKIYSNTFPSPSITSAPDVFLYEKDNFADSFSDIFSIFPADETEDEIRMVKGWGERIHPLCHAYDRAFCKFLDHIEYAATLFISMDPGDIQKKILNFGSLNIGKFDAIANFPNALKAIVEGLVFLDSIIDAITFTKGLNKTELMGEGRGAEIADILLTMEGRIHKHFSSRFSDRYTIHHKKTLGKVNQIALSDAKLAANKEVEVKYFDYLTNRGVPKKLLQNDSTSDYNCGLPSDWEVEARKPDGSGLTGSLPHVVQQLQPYISSLPETGFKYILSRVIADAFGDEDMVHKILPDTDIQSLTAEADLQMAEVQAAVLTSGRSEFDRNFDLSPEIDPKLTDVHMFVTFPASSHNDHIIFCQVLLSKVDDAVERFNRKEIGKTTEHIWMYNLVSTAQGHVEMLRKDDIRKNRPESQQIFQRFGQAFNLLRQAEAQGNSERTKRLDELQQKMAAQDQNDPKMITAMAKLTEARTKQTEVQLKYGSNQIQAALDVAANRRAEESHILDSRLKLKDLHDNTNGNGHQSQSLVGRPGANEQRGS